MLTGEQSFHLLDIQDVAFGRHEKCASLPQAILLLGACNFKRSPAVFILKTYFLFLFKKSLTLSSCDELFQKALQTEDPHYIYLAVLLLKNLFGESKSAQIKQLLLNIINSRYVDDGYENFIAYLQALWMYGTNFQHADSLELFAEELKQLHHDLKICDLKLDDCTRYDVMEADYLAQCYFYGMGVPKDIGRAISFARFGSRFGYPASVHIVDSYSSRKMILSSPRVSVKPQSQSKITYGGVNGVGSYLFTELYKNENKEPIEIKALRNGCQITSV